ncbi:MAG: hypothetical protein KTR25_14830 [Myxococcales bacterium]|nr:hypothetical protein [Myxococcales bacterium]
MTLFSREPLFVAGVLVVRVLFYLAAVLVILTLPWLGSSLPTERLGAVALMSALMSVVASRVLQNWSDRRSVVRAISVLLLYDALALTLLLAPAGGVANPFTMLYFCQVTLAALALPRWGVAVAIAGASIGYGTLFWVDSGHVPHDKGGDYAAHLQGMWFAFTVTSLLIGGVVSQLTQALLREREMRSRAHRLLGLTTLAAGAAHEIGNPLGTIKLVASDLEQELRAEAAQPRWADDAKIIVEEVNRARDVLRKMARGAGEIDGEGPRKVYVADILRAMEERMQSQWSRVVVKRPWEMRAALNIPLQATAQALVQLIRNGFEASPSELEVVLQVHEAADDVTFIIEDRGIGMEADVLERVGEPFFTTKAPGHGTGLGVFLARTLFEQLGGELQITSSTARGLHRERYGTQVIVCLPRSDV